MTRIPSVPLILSDPYFSIWSPADELNSADTQSWTGKKMPITGILTLDDVKYSVIGSNEQLPKLPQVDLTVTPTQSKYTFKQGAVILQLTFAQHFDLVDLQSVSEPVTYFVATLNTEDGQQHTAQLTLEFGGQITYETLNDNRLVTKTLTVGTTEEVFVGKARQTPLDSSGDLIDIDWGYLYLAAGAGSRTSVNAYTRWNQQGLAAHIDLSTDTNCSGTLLIAYDDLQSINYFGQAQPAYWRQEEPSLPQLLDKRQKEVETIIADCVRIDEMVSKKANIAGGSNYQLITATAYRQAIAAHKLIRDEQGKLVFLSKECNSNGCIGTVDVSYPSIPLFLAYQPQLVEAMMRPILRFAQLPVWPFDYAPHDVGRYPYATGQVYGFKNDTSKDDSTLLSERDTVGMLYQFPVSADIYDERYQMPVEECGDMIIMASTVDLLLHDGFLLANHDQLMSWSQFLLANGQDPDNQLCTDDFAGHLAHNVNLSLKAIVALAALGKALAQYSEYQVEAAKLTQNARRMASIWQKQAKSSSDTRLAFDQPNSWALKYNLIWDQVLNLQLFPENIAQQEVQRYLHELNEFGVPLDSRASYTKVDWLMWVAALANNQADFDKLSQSVVNFLEKTDGRQPFSDWYDTKSGKMVAFKNRSVIGGVFMPLLKALQNFN